MEKYGNVFKSREKNTISAMFIPIYHCMTSLLISSNLLSYKIIRNLFLSGCSLCAFALLFTYQKLFDVFFLNVFLDENKGVHKLAARTAIRQ